MIQRDPPFFWDVTCDECGFEERIDIDTAATFFCVVDHIKGLGWKVFRRAREWTHLCPECATQEEFDV